MLSKFFVISKIFSFICSPLIWIILIFTLSLIVKSKKIKKKFFISGFICLLFFSNSFIVDEFIRLWEVPAKSYTEYQNKKYTAGIVLGGGMVSKDAKTGRIAFRDNIDRILQAIDLYKKGIIQKIIISSGSGSLIYRNVLESTILKDYLVNILDIPETDILVDSLSDNTHQNAVHTALIINENFIIY